MTLELSSDTPSELKSAIKRYFLDERDEEIGDLQASFVPEFVVVAIGRPIYNQAIQGAR